MVARPFFILINMRKQFLLFTLLLGSITAWGHDVEVDGIYYNLHQQDTTASVTFKGDAPAAYRNEYTGEVVIPETVTVEGIPYIVTSVGDRCFYECNSLTSVSIPGTVKSLGDMCFYDCSGLVSVNLPESVTSLGDGCFEYCTS